MEDRIPDLISAEGREDACTVLAYDLAEKQLREGTATSQLITHFLQAGSRKAKLELEKLRQENENLKAKTAALENESSIKELCEEAINAMRMYSGN